MRNDWMVSDAPDASPPLSFARWVYPFPGQGAKERGLGVRTDTPAQSF